MVVLANAMCQQTHWAKIVRGCIDDDLCFRSIAKMALKSWRSHIFARIRSQYIGCYKSPHRLLMPSEFLSSNFNLYRVFALNPTNQNCNLLLMVTTTFLCYLCLSSNTERSLLLFLPPILQKSLNHIAMNAGK